MYLFRTIGGIEAFSWRLELMCLEVGTNELWATYNSGEGIYQYR